MKKFSRMGERNAKGGEIYQMGEKDNKEEFSVNEFSAIVKKAYDRGKSDDGMTVQKLLVDLKHDLLKLKVQ